MSRLTPSLLVLDKGLDLQTAKILAPEGSVFDSLNYEQVDFQGQKRIDGYARYDGTVLPAFNDYYKIAFSPTGSWTGFPEDSNTNLFVDNKLWAVAIKNANVDGDEAYIQILDHSMDVVVGDSLQVNGSSIGTITSLEEGKTTDLDVEEHYLKLLELSSAVKSRVTTLPEPIAGLHWFKDRLYAVAGIQKINYTLNSPVVVQGEAPDGFVNFPYTFTYTASGGIGELTFSIHDGNGDSIEGITIDASTGVASFNFSSAADVSFYVRATDALGIFSEITNSIKILDRLPFLDLTVCYSPTTIRALSYSATSKTISVLASSTISAGGTISSAAAIGDVYIAAGTASPYIFAWKRNGVTMTPMSSPVSPPTGAGQIIAVYEDVVFIGHQTSPYISAYRVDQTTGFTSKFANPTSPPAGAVKGISVHPSGDYVVVVGDGSPSATAYRWDSMTGFGEKLTSPAPSPVSATGASFNESGSHVAISSISNPVVRIYQWNDGFGALSGSLPDSLFGSRSVSLSDKAGLVVSGSEGGGANALVYRWSASGGVGAKIVLPANFPLVVRSTDISSDGSVIAFSSSDVDGIGVCEWDQITGVLASPSKSGTTSAQFVKF